MSNNQSQYVTNMRIWQQKPREQRHLSYKLCDQMIDRIELLENVCVNMARSYSDQVEETGPNVMTHREALNYALGNFSDHVVEEIIPVGSY